MSIESEERRARAAILRVQTGAEKELVREYKDALTDIKKELSRLYEKHSVDGTLTYAEMSKYNRLKSLTDTLNVELAALGQAQDKTIKTLVGNAYEESFYRYGYSLDASLGTDIGFGIVNRDTILGLINEPNVSGLSLKDQLSRQRYDLLIRQRQTMVQGFIKGDSYPKIARAITDSFGTSLNNALRIARTEGTRAATEGQVAAYDEAEAKGVEIERIWIASLDGRTRGEHRDLDGQPADEEGLFHYGTMTAAGPGLWGDAAMDINCRCDIRAEVKGFPPKLRRDKEGVGEYLTYYEWKKNQESE